jgi:hypothetical protein
MWQKKEAIRKDVKDSRKGKETRRAEPSVKDPRKFLDNSPRRTNPKGVGLNTKQEWPEALSQQIVVYHESQSTESGSDWMSKLKEDSAQFLAEQRGVHLKQIYKESLHKQGIESLMDKIYGLMQRYCFEFNQVASGTDLHVASTICGDVTEVLRYNRFREIEETLTYFRARLSTKYLSLVLRGKDDIQFYVIPTNQIMALSKYENEYRPIATIQVKFTDQGMMWRMKDSVPPVDSLEELSMWLFTNLVQESKRAAKDESQAAG